MTISQVSKGLGVSTRTLRYYEQIGLLPGKRTDDYAYRVYDAQAVARLRQIIVLRKLRIPLRQIGATLQNQDSTMAIEAFRQHMSEIDNEIAALSTIRGILAALVDRLRESADVRINPGLFDDKTILSLVASLSADKIRFKEEKTMEDLNKADESLSKLNDVRIVYLPPAAVAASHYIGEEPEHNASKPLDKFVMESGLCKIKPDLRHYGFNHPNPSEGKPVYGYEMWVTIPDDMEVPAPLEKKKFAGGLYAAHMIPMGNFHEWDWLIKWAYGSPDYQPNMLEDGGECMYGLLEEHLNYINHVQLVETEPEGMQLDLLLPVKEKKQA
jgi:DNA-binding transcriptional MerR regulator